MIGGLSIKIRDGARGGGTYPAALTVGCAGGPGSSVHCKLEIYKECSE